MAVAESSLAGEVPEDKERRASCAASRAAWGCSPQSFAPHCAQAPRPDQTLLKMIFETSKLPSWGLVRQTMVRGSGEGRRTLFIEKKAVRMGNGLGGDWLCINVLQSGTTQRNNPTTGSQSASLIEIKVTQREDGNHSEPRA